MMMNVILIFEIIFLVFSGICYMSLNVYTEKERFFCKRLLFAIVLLGITLPGMIAGFVKRPAENTVMQGIVIVSSLFGLLAVGWLLFLGIEGWRKTLAAKKDGKEKNDAGSGLFLLRWLREGKVWEQPKQPVTSKELWILLGITFVYGILLFYRLGSQETPQTALQLVADGTQDEIILDLGEEKEIAGIEIYLGHMLDRVVALSYYDGNQKEWIPLEEELTMESNYCWNRIEVNQKLRYLGLVSRSAVASYQELVILDESGERLIPVNAEDYPQLFDEQELYPEEMTYYDTTMFDEVYYAGSAYEFLNGMPMYETTHPPMGKLLIAIGEAVFGVTPFGWRFMCALFGWLMVPLFFWFLYLVTGNGHISLLGTVLYCLDFMHYTLSRIATLDSLVAFFVLLMVTLFLVVLKRADRELSEGRKQPSLYLLVGMTLDGLVVGMAVAVKWTGFYAMLGMALVFVFFIMFWIRRLKKEEKSFAYAIKLCLIGICNYSILPFVVYLFSFLPQKKATEASNLFQVMWDSSRFMLEFHSDIVFEHPYESPWYSWILDLVPLLDSVNSVGENQVSMIATMGNPFIWWLGAAAFFYLLVRVFRHRDKTAAILCFCYLMMLVPWWFVTRTVFIYQYYISSIFLCGMLGYALSLCERKRKYVVPVCLEAALFLFLMFFPIISGVPVGGSHIMQYLQWFDTWKFTSIGGGV